MNGLKEQIAAVMERSACDRFETSDKVLSARHALRAYFSGLAFDFSTNTFSDPSECTPRQIPDLASTRLRFIKLFSDAGERKAVTAEVSRVDNAWKQAYKRKVVAVDEIYSAMVDAIERRKNSPFCHLLPTVEGAHKFPGRCVEFAISGDPVDILQKATGMPWETISCEKYGGEHFNGIYSDIENCNMTCVIQDAGKSKYKFARIMLRWCLTEEGKVGIGMEPEWYFANASDIGTAFMESEREIAPNLKAFQATRFIVDFLESTGYMIYEECVTPYAYEGFSDTSGHGVQITFKKKRACK